MPARVRSERQSSSNCAKAQVDRFPAEQLPTPPNQGLVVGFAGWQDLVHCNALYNLTLVVVGVALRTSRDLPRRPG
jgi:hypothetical protein